MKFMIAWKNAPGHHKPAVHVSHTRRRRNRGEVLHWVLTEPHYREEVP